MPRDASGVYTLPIGNPVVTNTLIASTWANTTMSDIAAQLNNVLTRDGLLGPTGPFKVQDGTVVAPGLAWASETGLGWYRGGAGLRNFATGGVKVEGLDTSAAGTTALGLWPRVAGSSYVTFNVQPATSADRNVLVVGAAAANYFISENIFGAATAKTLNLGFPAGVTASGPISALSSGVATTGGLWVGPPNTFGLYDTSQFWVLQLNNTPSDLFFSKTTGTMAYRVAGTQLMTVDATGFMNLKGFLAACQGAPNMWKDASNNYLGMGSAAGGATWSWRWNNVSGDIHWLGLSAAVLIAFDASGNAGKASGAGSWLGVSDVRIKENIEDYTTGLAEVLALRPRTFNYRRGAGRGDEQHAGMIAQEIETVMPDTVMIAPEAMRRSGDFEYDDMLVFDPTNITYALVNSVKELHARISHLELQAQ